VRSGTGALNVTSTNGALTINSGTGALGISNDAAATTVSLATGAGVKTVTLGSTNTTSTTNLQSGSGGIKIPAFTEGALVTSSAGVISTVTGTAGNVLTANAAGVSPSFQPATGITTINGNTGSITGSTVTIRAFNATGATNEGTVRFTNSSTTSNLIFTDDSFNVGIGRGVLGTMTSATENTALGGFTMGAITSGSSNVGIGVGSISTLQTGSNNVAVGNRALNGVGLTGSGNIGIGTTAGSSLTGSEASNVLIGNGVTGTSGESRAIHLADTGAASATKCFIGGIRGVTTGVNNAIAVLIDSAGQLGTVSSSKRFKENIVPMPSSFSGNLLSLNPTLFNYKQDETKTQTWGLIAEEVQQIFPGLVVNDQEGFPLTVKYHELPVLLLNELIKLKKEVEMLKQERTISSH
jgi:hypothetical protein